MENEIRNELAKLDGTNISALSMMTGYSVDEINELGGVREN